eukprot:Skav209332  [mRNA]  locus=scaffold241:476:7318:+ [translate_table: standard]
MSNINENDEWIQSESFEYMGQKRHHVAGQKVGRVLEPWRKLRKERPDLFRHFRVMSQPASNMDGILMSWQIREQSAQYPLSLWQRDCFGAVFTDQVRQTQFMGHQVQATIMSKMTSALQLTDTDFSHEFKSLMKREVDEKRRLGMMRQREDVAAPSDIHKLSIMEIAECLDKSMQKMIEKNDEKQWVLAGLRRNGFLVMRPDQQGKMVHQVDQPWCEDKPIGSSRISQTWMKNRLSWVKEGGMKVEPPVWERIEGAKELADLIEWSYSHEKPKQNEMIDLDELPDWVEACQFQLPLDLRRQLALKESTMSEAQQARRSKLKEKRQQRKLRTEAKAALVEVLSKECPPGGLEAQTVQYGWLLMRYFCSGKSMNELENITMLDPMLCHALGAVKKEEEHGLELDKLIQLFKREMSHKKTFFHPLMSGGHWALLVVDKIHDDIRYYDSLCGDPDRSKIGTEDEITNLPEKCLAMAERLLGAMMSLSVVPDGFCDRPALRRANVRTRQPWGTNQCGHFILAYMEAELLNELGYGPAASGWPAASAHHWHERLRKLTNQLHEEIPKYKRDLKAADEKLLRSGERAHAEMVKEAKVAQMRLDKQETLTELQKTAYEFVHENRYIKISELPPECEKDRMRIIHHEANLQGQRLRELRHALAKRFVKAVAESKVHVAPRRHRGHGWRRERFTFASRPVAKAAEAAGGVKSGQIKPKSIESLDIFNRRPGTLVNADALVTAQRLADEPRRQSEGGRCGW